MKYIYTQDMCSACTELKVKYDAEGTKYKERNADRLKNPANDVDDIDKVAFAQLAMQNNVFPVEVEV
ncbi:MAG: hypothetical protein V3U54_09930 [Thermodesulfobacteriota bacterium]